MKRLLFIFMLVSTILLAQSAIENHEWMANSGRWWVHVDTTYYMGYTGTTTIGGEAFMTWPFASLFVTLSDTVTTLIGGGADASDSTNVSILVFQSPTNDITTAVFVDSLTLKGTSTTEYTVLSAAGRYGSSLNFPFLECRYTWFKLHKMVGNRARKYNRCISTWSGWNSTAGIISTY